MIRPLRQQRVRHDQQGNVCPPPSTRKTCPLMNADASVQRNPTTPGPPRRDVHNAPGFPLLHHHLVVDGVDPQEPFGHGAPRARHS
ncbi:MAG: hypothetical protein CM1200mP2_01030 [Planctomycetaceae bacterium]|nr:MAG: hypothetical protein CM1200mP2_01030 [Planctomycetaceae bacterium]